MARDWFENHFSEQLQVSNCIRHNLFCKMNWEIFAILHLYISCRIDWFIDFFSPYHHTSTRRISFSKREWHAIKSTFFLIASESSSSKAVSLKIEEVFEFNENRHFTETKNNVCQGSWLFVSQVFLLLSLSLSSGPPVSLQTVKTQRTIKYSKSTWLSFLHVVPFNL